MQVLLQLLLRRAIPTFLPGLSLRVAVHCLAFVLINLHHLLFPAGMCSAAKELQHQLQPSESPWERVQDG